MPLCVAEYLGQRTDIDVPDILPSELVLQREVGHVIREGREGRKGSDMLTRHLAALGEKVCRMPVFPSRKRPNWHRWCNLFASFASFVDQLRVVILMTRRV